MRDVDLSGGTSGEAPGAAGGRRRDALTAEAQSEPGGRGESRAALFVPEMLDVDDASGLLEVAAHGGAEFGVVKVVEGHRGEADRRSRWMTG